MQLSELQQTLASHTTMSANDNTSGEVLFGGKLGGTAQRIYRNNRMQALRASLKQHYPTIHLLLGDDYFDHLSAAFIESHPAQQRDMNHYGEGFPDWLVAQQLQRLELSNLPYLADSARFDHLCHTSYYAPNRQPWPAEQFAALSGEQQTQACLMMAQDIYPLQTSWPVDKIKLCSASGQPLDLFQTQDNYYFMIHRPEYQPQSSPMSESEFRLANALLQQISLQQLLQDNDEQSPMHQHIFRWIECGWINDFQIPSKAC